MAFYIVFILNANEYFARVNKLVKINENAYFKENIKFIALYCCQSNASGYVKQVGIAT